MSSPSPMSVGHSNQKTPTTHPSVCPRHRTFHEREALGQFAKAKISAEMVQHVC